MISSCSSPGADEFTVVKFLIFAYDLGSMLWLSHHRPGASNSQLSDFTERDLQNNEFSLETRVTNETGNTFHLVVSDEGVSTYRLDAIKMRDRKRSVRSEKAVSLNCSVIQCHGSCRNGAASCQRDGAIRHKRRKRTASCPEPNGGSGTGGPWTRTGVQYHQRIEGERGQGQSRPSIRA
jgi:hypothetical protein